MGKRIKMKFRVVAFVLTISCLITSAAATADVQQRASWTRRTSETIEVTIPQYKGKFDTYDSFIVEAEVYSNITFNPNTGVIYEYSRPGGSIVGEYPNKTISASFTVVDYYTSSDEYTLTVEGFFVFSIVYTHIEFNGVPHYEPQYDYVSDPITVYLSPQ